MKILPAVDFSGNRAALLIHFIVWLALVVRIVGSQLPGLQEGNSFGIYQDIEGNTEWTTITDFPSHFNFVQKAWKSQTTVGAGSSVYSVQNHQKITSDWAGREIDIALPFGYSPTMMWILLPLVPFSHATAFFLFNIAGLLAVYWMTYPGRTRWGTGLLLFFSFFGNACFGLGQTAILSGAGLLFLADRTVRGCRADSWRDALSTGSVLWALTAKPPVALIAVPVLLGLRRWQTLVVAVALTAATTLVLTPWLGEHWARDYIRMIASYDTVNAGPAFAWSLHPEAMSNLRAMLDAYLAFPDDVASRISSVVWLGGVVWLTMLGLRSRVSPAKLWSFSIVLYLLFCPHVTRTEILQIVVILSLSVSVRDALTRWELALLLVLPMVVFIPHPIGPPAPGFASLALLCLILMLFPRKPDRYGVPPLQRPVTDASSG